MGKTPQTREKRKPKRTLKVKQAEPKNFIPEILETNLDDPVTLQNDFHPTSKRRPDKE